MRVISKIPNMSTLCSGVRFYPLRNGAMVSEEIVDQETIDRFLSISGFEVCEPEVRQVGSDGSEGTPSESGGSPSGDTPPPSGSDDNGGEGGGQEPDSSAPQKNKTKKAKESK